MSTTTDILFNSPALHALKRDQLIKLCKIHSIKVTGKNAELVEKLKKHAETLPKNDPLSVASRSENPSEEMVDEQGGHEGQPTVQEQSQSANARWGFQMPRLSEKCDVMMEKIDEAEEGSSRGTINSLRTIKSTPGGVGEFGTGMSKSPSVAPSLKSLASSFGLNRGNMQKAFLQHPSSFPASSSSSSGLYSAKDDIIVEHLTPYSSIPKSQDLPQTDHLTFDPMQGVTKTKDAPLPGHSLRPGVPAPSNARLSLGLNAPSTPTRDEPTTTIRLISNPVSGNSPYGTPQLKPFKTSFDLEFGSPEPVDGFLNVNLWPQSEGKEKGIYPALPLEDLTSLSGNGPVASSSTNNMDVDNPLPGSHTTRIKASPRTGLSPAPASTEPFVFGSPLPQHNVSNAQFKSAATSVLEEMNKRLALDGVNGVGMDLISRLQPGARTQVTKPLEVRDKVKKSVIKDKFDEIHAQESTKMEGIDSFVKRRGLVPKTQSERAKKQSSVGLGHGVGRDRFGRRVAGESRRLSAAHVVGERRRLSTRVIPGSFDDDDDDDEDNDNIGKGDAKPAVGSSVAAEDAKGEDVAKAMEAKAKGEEEKEREREDEERKQKEREAIKRKLEINKAKRRSSVGVAGAKGRVSVGRDGVLIKPQQTPAKPSRFGFLSSAKSLVQKVWGGGKSAAKATKAVPAPPPKKAPAPTRPSTATNPPMNKAPSTRTEKEKLTLTINSTTTTQARLPLPSLDPAKSSLPKPNRMSSATATGTSATSSFASRNRTLSSGTIGSMGSKKLLAGSGSHTSVAPSTSGGSSSSRLSSRMSSSSRLLAPTASSLAKINRPSMTNSKSSLLRTVAQAAGVGVSQTPRPLSSEGQPLGTITKNSRSSAEPWSPRPDKIFSKPLTIPSKIPTPVRKRPTTAVGEDQSKAEMGATAAGTPAARQRSLNGRKPRISRSKVIAKLASQRAAGATGATVPPGGTPSAKAGRTRSSLGGKVQRSSYGGKPVSYKAPVDNVMMSAKKRVRQSEYARRKSRAAPIDYAAGGAMDVDME